jgi:hypothetical protein
VYHRPGPPTKNVGRSEPAEVKPPTEPLVIDSLVQDQAEPKPKPREESEVRRVLDNREIRREHLTVTVASPTEDPQPNLESPPKLKFRCEPDLAMLRTQSLIKIPMFDPSPKKFRQPSPPKPKKTIDELRSLLKEKEIAIYITMLKSHNKDIKDFEKMISLESASKQLFSELSTLFLSFKNDEILQEFVSLVTILITNIQTKGTNFLSNDFVDFLLAEKTFNKKFMFAFGRNAEKTKLLPNKSPSSLCDFLTSANSENFRETLLETFANENKLPMESEPSQNEAKLISSLRFTNEILLNKQKKALGYILASPGLAIPSAQEKNLTTAEGSHSLSKRKLKR